MSLPGSQQVWEEMVSACWCGLLAALSLLLDARYIRFPSLFSPTLTLFSALFSDSGDLSLNCSIIDNRSHPLHQLLGGCGGRGLWLWRDRGAVQWKAALTELLHRQEGSGDPSYPEPSGSLTQHLVVNTFMFFALYILQFCILLFKPLHHWHRPLFFFFYLKSLSSLFCYFFILTILSLYGLFMN